ncbi:M42 family metallopeptidase [Fusibacter sp. 3D3]|uniref:M42 family metallopeptidase n=1 Tax=Fusibacter sp. 3D3 TaxID=1048380 RepID=UPI000853B7DD|nr:M42 family metallopeptidase [Fusibacter sp. 3D3]GAU79788.1 deblocking aminopeptidase [Fusibacter sp. 3D3]
MALLKKLTQLWGVAGREKAVHDFIKNEIISDVDQCYSDALGNLIAVKKGNGRGKKIMIAAHMDEIGLQVTKIEPDGRIKAHSVGWVWASAVYNDKVVFQNGTVGVVGCEGKIEDAKNDTTKLYIDIGCTSKEETLKYVNIGDYCGFMGPYHEMKDQKICAKSIDDRVGCYILIEAIKQIKAPTENDLYFVFTVQEEVGCRGAVVAAERIKPDIGIAIDITPDHIYPSDLSGSNAVGEGVAIKVGDPSAMIDEALLNQMINCCEKHEIKYQRDVMDRGGTDISSINRSNYGVRVAGISIVTRYPHSQSALISLEDVTHAINLVKHYVTEPFVFEDTIYK